MERGDIVVILPGITGSVLEKDGKEVFGATFESGFRALFSGGRSIRGLALTDDPVDVDVLDGVRATRIASDVQFLPKLPKIDGYTKLTTELRRIQDDLDVREFPYDWRRDNRVAARRLRTLADDWLLERRREVPGARLVLVAHSMGGLVSRYFLEVLDGWRDTRHLITFGTPYYGSANALDFVANGFSKLQGLIDLSTVLRSFTSIYQLLPIYRCITGEGADLVGLGDVAGRMRHLDPKRFQAAKAFHDEITTAVMSHQDDAEYRERGYTLIPVVGIDHPTLQVAALAGDGCTLSKQHPKHGSMGDGTVPRLSSSPQEATSDAGAMFAGTRHASLQNADAVLTGVRGFLTAQDLGVERYVGAPVNVSVDIDDVYAFGEPIRLTVTPFIRDSDKAAAPKLRVLVSPVAVDGEPAAPSVRRLDFVEGPLAIELPTQTPGVYRITVTGNDKVEPVSDLILQAGPAM